MSDLNALHEAGRRYKTAQWDKVAATEELHRWIRAAVKAGHSYRAVARAAGVSHSRVQQIVKH